jgi:hypothetical protein
VISVRTANGRRTAPVRAAVVLATIAISLLTTATTALAADPGEDLLADPDAQVRWAGKPFVNSNSPPLPEACGAADCDEFALELGLPANVWRRPGGLQIGIRWHDPEEAQDLDLYVYGPDGSLTAKSDGFFASVGEQVVIPRAANGAYRVVVVPRNTNETGLEYRGLAEVERFVPPRPRRKLLPDLISKPPRNLMFSIGGYLTNPAASLPSALGGTASQLQAATNCYPEEMTEQGAQRCLRFDQIIANIGTGPFELRYRMEGLLTDQALVQRIYRSDGSYRDRRADSYVFHPAHAHFHYRNFAQSSLWKANRRGRIKGSQPVRVGQKNGFCMIDVENTWFGRKGDAARTYYFPRCNTPAEQDDDGTYMVNGISAGWADVYNWYLADQFIEISGVADGCYVLKTVVDSNDTVVESDGSNNSSFALLQLAGDSATFIPRQAAPSLCG